MKLSVVGLGKLGAPLAAALASRGHSVVGVDLVPATVEAINAGRAPVVEPGLQDLLDVTDGRLRATADIADAVANSEVTFILVPTPSGPDGGFVLDHVLPALEQVGAAAAAKGERHLVVITSTVMPGSTDGPIREALERSSGLTVGEGIGLCYSPEFIALGSVVRDLLHPDLILVGESDPESGQKLGDLMSSVVLTEPPVQRMNLVNAELAKISVNTFVTTKISYANMLAEMCEQLPDADVDAVTAAIGLDSRIGSKYLKGATPYGGPCFPRDNVALSRLARSLGVIADIAEATDAINRRQVDRLATRLVGRVPAGGRVAILGLSYKPDTPVVEEAFGMGLAAALVEAGLAVDVHDPAALESARSVLGSSVTYHDAASACLVGADAVVIATPWPEFAELTGAAFDTGRKPLVVDCWRILPEATTEALEVWHIGTGAQI